jgi:23S rRNA (guanine745-N1)-methyltransferase
MRQAIAQYSRPDAVQLVCPLCGDPCHARGASLYCSHGHTFDISRHGSVDLRRKRVESSHYTASFFQARQKAQQAGLYRALTAALQKVCSSSTCERPLVDVGCGDGSITAAVGADVGVDISSEAIQLASRHSDAIEWICADSNRLPFADRSISTLLTVFAPTDYWEARRVSKTGRLIKVVPGPQHMHQLRSVLGVPAARNSAQSEVLVRQHAVIVKRTEVKETIQLRTSALRQAVALMSPVSFGRLSRDMQQWSAPQRHAIDQMTSITTDSVILVCNLK